MNIKTILAAAGAIAGIGGAYANVHAVSEKWVAITYNWYTPGGDLAFSATLNVAKSICNAPNGNLCLIGTAYSISMPPITLYRP